MIKAKEVMTQTLATCEPEASVAQVAAIMRDRDIGNVLIVKDGKLSGIVTDRDLSLNVLNGMDDPLRTPIKKYMNSHVVTGKGEWSLERVAKTMAKHQIRRLPIVQHGQLVGIISLGDLALYEDRHGLVKKSLRAISTPNKPSAHKRSVPVAAVLNVGLAAFATSVIGWLTWSHSGKGLRKQINKSDLYHTARHAVSMARDRVDGVVSSKPVRNLRQQIRSNLKGISTRLPSLVNKSPKRKRLGFGRT